VLVGESSGPIGVDANISANQQPSLVTRSPLTIPPLPENIHDLFETYFAYTHTWLPFVDKFKLSAFAYSQAGCAQRATTLTPCQSANLALAWAVAAYAYTRAPDAAGSNPGDSVNKFDPRVAAEISLSLIPAFSVDLDHEHIQALVLLAVFHFENDNHRLSWLLIGLAGRVAVDLSAATPGQHLSSTTRRTSLACFVVENIIAASLDRRPQTVSQQRAHTVNDRTKANIYELEAEGWEEWSRWEMPGSVELHTASSRGKTKEPFRIISTFNRTVSLAGILNTGTSSNQLIDPDSPTTTDNASRTWDPELSSWTHDTRDLHPSMDYNNTADSLLPHIVSLRAVYLLSRCTLLIKSSHSRCDEQGYKERCCQLAAAVNELASRYRAAHPAGPIPLGLIGSMMVAMQLPGLSDSLKRLLSTQVHAARHDREVTMSDGLDFYQDRDVDWFDTTDTINNNNTVR
jgi:hypothetical protein